MARPADHPITVLTSLDRPTRSLVRLAARITGGTEEQVREGLAECGAAGADARWIDELVLQSYLFAGFPRALNAARELRRAWGSAEAAAKTAAPDTESYADLYSWRLRGEDTCRAVYGEMYDRLRDNIRRLHPAFDDWMIVEGYGKVLSRGGLDIGRRELCIVAACVAAGQERQLHSHLHGARNVGVPDDVIGDALGALDGLGGVVSADALVRARLLWERVKGKPHAT